MIVSSRVPAGFQNALVVDYLAARFTYFSQDEWAERVVDGRIACNDAVCDLTTTVRQGDRVAYHLDEPDEPPDIPAYRIIYEDEWLLGIDKPPGLLMHASRQFVRENLIFHLRQWHEPPFPEAHLVNRLDKDTSGVVLVGKTKAAAVSVQQQFRETAVAKIYLAIVHGHPEADEGVIDQPIGRLPSLPGVHRYGSEGAENPKEAQTAYRVRQRLATSPLSALVELHPHTGRTHQLRVHLAAMGHPIVGDTLYTLSDADFLAQYDEAKTAPAPEPLPRQALHCAATTIFHPETGEPVTVTAPLPADMVAWIERVTR